MTKKEKTISGIKILIKDRYTDNLITNCPLCPLHNTDGGRQDAPCAGCPNCVFEPSLSNPCFERETYNKWALHTRDEINLANKEFWETALPQLEKLPAVLFTAKGWKPEPFEFLIDLDEQIAKKYNLI